MPDSVPERRKGSHRVFRIRDSPQSIVVTFRCEARRITMVAYRHDKRARPEPLVDLAQGQRFHDTGPNHWIA
jgi:hypothetical protein